MKIVRVCKAMTPDQRALIIAADFGGTLGMKLAKLIPELCSFLMSSFNPRTCELDFGDRGKIPITDQSVKGVMGVPMGSVQVPYHLDCDATSLILNMLKIEDGIQPTVSSLETQLGPMHPADDDYLRKFVIYIVSSCFAPTTGIKVSPKCYPAVINTTNIKRLNWARFIKDILVQTANEKHKKNWFKVCMPYLMIKYVDSLEVEDLEVPRMELAAAFSQTRWLAVSPSLIQEATALMEGYR